MNASILPNRLVLKYYVYRATMSASFTASIWYLYIKATTGSYASLGIIDAVWWGGLILFEVPTGYIGDRIGRKWSLLIASCIITASQVAMGFASAFSHFIVIFLVWAFGSTFRSGTASAWLYDALATRIGEDEYSRVQGRGSSVGLVISGLTAVSGGYLADISMTYAYFASACVTALSIPLLLSFPEARGHDTDGEDSEFTILDAIPVIRERFTTPPLRSFVLYVGLFSGIYWGVNMFVQPVGAALGLSPTELGWLFGLFTAIGAGVSYFTGWIKDNVGIATWLHIVPFGLGLLFGAVAVLPVLAIPVFVVMRALRSTTMTLSSQFINDRIDSLGRATLLSTAGMAYRLVILPANMGAGLLAEHITPTATIGLFGLVLMVGAAAILIIESPFETTAQASKSRHPVHDD